MLFVRFVERMGKEWVFEIYAAGRGCEVCAWGRGWVWKGRFWVWCRLVGVAVDRYSVGTRLVVER